MGVLHHISVGPWYKALTRKSAQKIMILYMRIHIIAIIIFVIFIGVFIFPISPFVDNVYARILGIEPCS